MTEITTKIARMDEETTQAFIAKIDMARVALNDQRHNIEGYGSGINAAYKLLCEAQAMAPENHAIADEIKKLSGFMVDTTSQNQAAQVVKTPAENTATTTATTTNSSQAPSMAEQLMQQWQIKPVIEILVCVSENQLKGLADTIDSVSTQLYSNWKLTVISNMPSPDPVFQKHDILQWVQINDFQTGLNNAINSSSADWLGLIEAGGCLDGEALFALANHDNLKGDRWQIVYSDEDHIGVDNTYYQPIFKPDFDINQLQGKDLIGGFCFARKALLQDIDGINLSAEHKNDDVVLRATRTLNPSAIGHIPNILYHRPYAPHHTEHMQPQARSNIA